MLKFASVLCLVAALAAPPSVLSAADDTGCLTLGRTMDDRDALFSIAVSNTLFALVEAGICVVEKGLPARRLTTALLRGDVDGEFLRVAAYQDVVGDAAFPVEEPILNAMGFAVSRDLDITSLKDFGSLKLGILRGIVWQSNLSWNIERVVQANSVEQQVEMLVNGRVDAILIDEINMVRFPGLMSLPRILIAREDAFIYLHKSQAGMAEPIAKAIRAFKERGCRFEIELGGPDCHFDEPALAGD